MTIDEADLQIPMARLRRQAGTVRFEAGFADRVLARLEQPRTFAEGLQRIFVRLAPLAAAAAVILGTVNLISTRSSGQPLVERILGLPEVTLASAYSMDESAVGGETSR